MAGDINIDLSAPNRNKLENLISSYNLYQVVSEPTHFTENSCSLIDVMIVKNINSIVTSFVAGPFIPDLIHYHCPIVSVFNYEKPSVSTFKRNIWVYKEADFNKYRNILNNTDWDTILNLGNIDSLVKSFNDRILSAAKESIPFKTVTIRPNDVPG